MDHHKSLYKDRSNVLSPQQQSKLNRQRHEANRSRQRKDRFQDSRKISPSPTPHKPEVVTLQIEESREDVANQQNAHLVKLVSTNPIKLSRQEAFLKRFIEYRENKREEKQRQKEMSNKKKPFVVSAVCSTSSTTSSIVPRGHNKDFRPPVGLKNPVEEKKAVETPKPLVKGRPSVYTVVATPPRKTNDTDNKCKIAKKAIVTKNSTNPAKLAAKNLVSSLGKENQTQLATKPIARTTLKPRSLKMPPPPPMPSSTNKKSVANTKKTDEQPKQAGAAGKIKSLTSKRVETTKPLKRSPLKSRLAQNLKAKKPLNSSKRVNVPPLQLNGKKIFNLAKKNPTSEFMIQTPRDFSSQNPFEEFVTSTKLKDSSRLEGESPKESSAHNNSSAKRNILKEPNSPKEKTKEIATNSKKLNGLENVSKKYNFIRYSEANVSIGDQQYDTITNHGESKDEEKEEKTPIKSGSDEKPANYLSPFVSVSRGKVSLMKEKEKRNSIYLLNSAENANVDKENPTTDSPKYSVEVRRTLEAVRYFRKQLHDEIDRLHLLCDVWELYKDENLEKIQNANGEDMINVTIGQTRLLTAKKFMQFKGLIDRCESGATGINAVAYDGSEATRPITAVDLEGFWSMLGLQIDNLDKRFDNLKLWKTNGWQDPDEAKPKTKKNPTKVKKAKTTQPLKTKPTPFQQMMRNMRQKKNQNNENADIVLTPSKRPATRLSSNNSTPRKSTDKINSPRRLSIIVKDRKYFSPAATVISMPSPNRRSSILQRKSSQDSPKLVKHLQTFNEALDKLPSSLDLRKSALINGCMSSRRLSLNPQSPLNSNNNRKASLDSPSMQKSLEGLPQSPLLCTPAPKARKSILKTPGTAKSVSRNVIFNEKLRVKKFNFMVEDEPLDADDEDDANNTQEEDLAKNNEDETTTEDSPQRTLTLRNRKVKLRPSCEIEIPKM